MILLGRNVEVYRSHCAVEVYTGSEELHKFGRSYHRYNPKSYVNLWNKKEGVFGVC